AAAACRRLDEVCRPSNPDARPDHTTVLMAIGRTQRGRGQADGRAAVEIERLVEVAIGVQFANRVVASRIDAGVVEVGLKRGDRAVVATRSGPDASDYSRHV